MKKLVVMALFGLAGLAAFAGTCTITHISLVSTDGTHKTFAGQLDNTSGVNILQHNFVVAFIDSSNNLVETKSVSGCLRSIQNNNTDFFSAVSTSSSSGVSTGLARIAFDGSFKVGTVSSQDVTISGVGASRNAKVLTVTGTVKNNSSTKLIAPNACIVVRTTAGNVLITDVDSSMSDLAKDATDTFSVTITVPDDSTADSVDVYVDGLDSSDNPTAPESKTGTNITEGTATPTKTNTPVGTATPTPGAAAKLYFSQNPGGSTGGAALSIQPKVQVQDATDHLVTSSVLPITLTITTPAGATLSGCTAAVAAVSGVATFTGCIIDKAGTYTLTATSGALTGASAPFTISVGAASKLKINQPGNAASTVAFAPQPIVTVQDAGGNTVTTSTASITLSASAGTLACTNAGNLTMAAVAGVATLFTGCNITGAAGPYTITAASSGLTSATTTTITIS